LTDFSSAIIGEAVEARGLQQLSQLALERLAIYGNLLLKWNSRMNLTAIRDPEGILDRHIMESVAAAQFLPPGVATLLDFGSGAGLPGVPIAICREEIAVTLAESQSKKAAFLTEVSRSIGVAMTVHAGRVEALPARVQFDLVALRAVDRMAEAIKVARTRVAADGYLLLFLTEFTKDEMLKVAHARVIADRSISTNSSLLLCQVD
jgi:16S rRNA (guanine527-N7)-methyltransferase